MGETAEKGILSLKYYRPQLKIEDVENPPYIEARYYRKGRIKPVELIVIHTMEAAEKGNTAEAVAKYFQNSGVKASAHYCVDNNSVVQCVWDSNTAFACKNANANGVHIEHAGFAKQNREEWLDEYGIALLNISAQGCAYLSNKFDIPVKTAVFKSENDPTVAEKGICGHTDVPNHGSHWDPGSHFPYDIYFELVNQYLPSIKAFEG